MKENSKKKAVRKPLAVVKGFAAVVKDSDGNMFVRTVKSGRISVRLIDSEDILMKELLFRDAVMYLSKSVAEMFADQTKRDIFSLSRGNGYRPNPPFEAMAVPLTFKLG